MVSRALCLTNTHTHSYTTISTFHPNFLHNSVEARERWVNLLLAVLVGCSLSRFYHALFDVTTSKYFEYEKRNDLVNNLFKCAFIGASLS